MGVVARHTIRVAVAALALMLVGLAAAAAAASPGAAGPQGIVGNGETELLVQNREPVEVAATVVEFWPQRPAPPIQLTLPPIEPRGVFAVDLSSVSLHDGAYAVAAYSDQQIAVVDRTTWPAGGGAIAGNAPASGSEIVVPLVQKGPTECTLLAIQNVDAISSTVFDVELYGPEGDDPVITSSSAIGPGTSVIMSVCDDMGFESVPFGFVGSARIRGRGDLVVGAITDVVTSARAVYSLGGIPQDRLEERWVAPFVAADWAGSVLLPTATNVIRSTIAVVNVGDVAAEVNVTYRGMIAPCAGLITVHGDAPVRIPPHGMALLDQGPSAGGTAGESGLPPGCLATANLTAPGARLAGAVVVRYRAPGTSVQVEQAAAYDLLAVEPEPVSMYLPFAETPGTAPLGVDRAAMRAIAATGTGDLPSGTEFTVASRSVGTAATSLRALVPRIERRPPVSTWMFVTNVSDRDTTAVLEPYGADGRPVAGCGAYCAATLAPFSAHAWATRAIETLPEGDVGSARILADGPIAVTILEVDFPLDLRAYNAVSPARGNAGTAEHVPFAAR